MVLPTLSLLETRVLGVLVEKQHTVPDTYPLTLMRYAHNVGKVLAVPAQAVALLAALMLRGPQTTAELRVNCDRLHAFSDISAVEGFLNELAAREAGALVTELPRQPGTRETRWAHLLCGPPSTEVVRAAASFGNLGGNIGNIGGDTVTVSELAALRANVAELQGEVDALKSTLAKVCGELGIALPRNT